MLTPNITGPGHYISGQPLQRPPLFQFGHAPRRSDLHKMNSAALVPVAGGQIACGSNTGMNTATQQVGHDDMQDEAAQGVDALFYVEPVPAEGWAALAAAPSQQTGGGPVGLETSGSSREDDDDMEIDALQGCDALAY
ncbi:hypothetical protein ACKKBG_A34845 [Auxenochlorella protothecoides x Auxenochlorella symbiontica]